MQPQRKTAQPRATLTLRQICPHQAATSRRLPPAAPALLALLSATRITLSVRADSPGSRQVRRACARTAQQSIPAAQLTLKHCSTGGNSSSAAWQHSQTSQHNRATAPAAPLHQHCYVRCASSAPQQRIRASASARADTFAAAELPSPAVGRASPCVSQGASTPRFHAVSPLAFAHATN